MTATPPRYRTLDRPSPGLATIAAPDGRVALWALNQRARRPAACAQCGAVSAWNYRPANPHRRGKGDGCLCRPCVEDAPRA